MDYARKFKPPNLYLKTKQSQLNIETVRRGSPCGRTCKDEPAEEDHRLANWRRWQNDRHRRQKQLADTLKRKTVDLAINAHERVRTKNEDAELLRCANRPEVVNQDKARGNPAFWLLDEISDERQGINPVMSRERKNLPPLVDRVALPKMILKEKMLLDATIHPTNVNLRTKWDKGDYLRTRANQLKRELELLEPKRPEMENLMVLGKNFSSGDHKPEFIRTPVISIGYDEDLPKPEYLKHPDDRISLKIQDREFVLERGFYFEKLSPEESLKLQESKQDRDLNRFAYSVFDTTRVYKILKNTTRVVTWSLQFESQGSELNRQVFYFENRGSRVVHLEWRDVTPKFDMVIMQSARCDSAFYFDKSRQRVLPGQKLEFPIWFRSEKPLVASETWKLVTDPNIYPGTIHLRLWGMSGGRTLKLQEHSDRERLREFIDRRVRDSMVREFLNAIFMNATSKRLADDISYSMFFLEADVFRARNPMYHYHSLLVDQLRSMWAEVTGNLDGSCWNMSLEELRSILLRIEDPDQRRDRLKRFHEVTAECLLPSALYDRPFCDKRKLAWWIFGSYFNQFETESDFVLCRCCGVHCPPEPEVEGQEVTTTGGGESEVSFGRYGFPAIYHEVFYVRMYCLLCETVDRVCAVLDSYDYFNKETED